MECSGANERVKRLHVRNQNGISKSFFNYLLVLGFVVTSTVSSARAAMVYDENTAPDASASAAPAPTEQESARTQLRKEVDQEAKLADPVAPAPAAPVPAPAPQYVQPVPAPAPLAPPPQVIVVPAPMALTGQTVTSTVPAAVTPPVSSVETQLGAQSELEKASGSELLRRKRVREEIKNEDALQTRMEELRLRDESRRGEKVLGAMPVDDSPTPADLKAPAVGVAPAAGAMLPIPVGPQGPQPVPPVAPMLPGQDRLMMQQAAPMAPMAAETAPYGQPYGQPYGMTGSDLDRFDTPRSLFVLAPKIGTSGFSDAKGYSINSFVTWGADLGFSVNDMFSVMFGYSYTKFSAGIPNSNPYLYNYGYSNNFYGYGGSNYNRPIDIKQNVFDAGVRLYLLNRKATFRPFIGGSMGFGRSFINYNKDIRSYWGGYGVQNTDQDFTLDQFFGGVQGGFDIVLTKAMSFGVTGKYYGVLSSRLDNNYPSNQFYNNPYFNGYNYYNPYNFIYNDLDKQGVANAIADSGVYQVTGGITFSF